MSESKSVQMLGFCTSFPTIMQYLDEKQVKEIKTYFFFVSKKIHSYVWNEKINEIRKEYIKIESATPKLFNYSKKKLQNFLRNF